MAWRKGWIGGNQGTTATGCQRTGKLGKAVSNWKSAQRQWWKPTFFDCLKLAVQRRMAVETFAAGERIYFKFNEDNSRSPADSWLISTKAPHLTCRHSCLRRALVGIGQPLSPQGSSVPAFLHVYALISWTARGEGASPLPCNAPKEYFVQGKCCLLNSHQPD